MKTYSNYFRNFTFLLLLGLYASCSAQQKDTWTAQQLMEPSVLASKLDLPKSQQPVIIDIGPAGVIKGALEAGPAEEKKNIQKMKVLLQDIPKDKEVVIYCGCCPFSKCPNVRPAFRELMELGFTRPRLLNLSDNLKKDWIDKGYPLKEQ